MGDLQVTVDLITSSESGRLLKAYTPKVEVRAR